MVSADLARAAERLERQARPLSLTPAQLQQTGRRVDAEQPIAVCAWVPHLVTYVESELVDAEAIAWTSDAVLLRWTPEGASFPAHSWVWANAVRRRP